MLPEDVFGPVQGVIGVELFIPRHGEKDPRTDDRLTCGTFGQHQGSARRHDGLRRDGGSGGVGSLTREKPSASGYEYGEAVPKDKMPHL